MRVCEQPIKILFSDAGWSSLVARRAHNPKVVSSNLAPATKHIKGLPLGNPFFISGLCQFCVKRVYHVRLRELIRVFGEVI